MVKPLPAAGIELPASAFGEVFPFHFAFGPDWTIVCRGRSLARVCPLVVPGSRFDHLFEPVRPEVPLAFEDIVRAGRTLFLLKERSTGVLLRGQMLSLRPAQDVIVFLGSPWLPEAAAIAQHGLSFEDFATHDPALDLLHVLQSQKMAVADLKKLAGKLQAQRTELRAANERLREQEVHTRKLALIASRTNNGVELTDAFGRLEWVNEAFTYMTGYTLEEARGNKPGAVLQGPRTDPKTVATMGAGLAAGEGFSVEILNYTKSGRESWVALEVQPIRDEQRRISNWMGIRTDITARKESEKRIAIQFDVSKALVETPDMREATQRAMQCICEILGWQVGLMWRIEATKERMVLADWWQEPGFACKEFMARSQGMQFPHGIGLPGRIWSSREPAWIPDVTRDPNSPRSPFAEKEGLRGAFGFPIFVHNALWGVMEFFSRGIEEPNPMLLKTFSVVGDQLGLFIERREAEDGLREANALKRAILESANYSIISTSADGVIRSFNAAAERMLGYRSEEVLGKVTPAIFHDPREVAERAAFLSRELGRTIAPGFEAFVEKAALGEPDEREWTYIRKDGTRFPVLLSITAQFDDNRRLAGYVGIASDITERKAAEQNLRESESRQRAITDSAQDAILMMDPEGRVSHWNPAAERILGYAREEAMGHDLDALIAPSRYRETYRSVFQAFRQTGDGAVVGKTRDLEARRKDGMEIFVQLSLSSIQLEGGWHSVGILRDVTLEREQEETLLAAKQAAEAANRAKSEFLATMSHEIRTPMNAIIGMTNLLLSSRLDPKQTEFAGTVARSGEALLELINEILDFSKIESGEHFQMEDEVFSLRELAEGVAQLLRSRAEAKKISLTVEVDPSIAYLHRSDDGRLRQVLVNLAGNGIKFTEKGHVAIRMRRLGGDQSVEQLRFEVEDTGIGISAGDQSGLFQPFSQVDSTASRRRDGTGLGLAISKRIVELMGGRIGVQSSAGQGSVFWFEFTMPVAESSSAGSGNVGPEMRSVELFVPAVEAKASTKPLRILVAEDHDTNRRLAQFMLENLGQRPDFAGNGIEALEAWERQDYDVILMDCQMPEMDGFEAAREIRRREAVQGEGKCVRIIALTANALKGDRERCLAAGMDGYMSKPFTLEQLRDGLALHQNLLPESTSEPTDQPLVPPADFDHSRPTQLWTELGEEGVRAIMEDFLRELPETADRLSSLANAGQAQELARLAHSIQGIGLSLGLDKLAGHCLALEEAANRRDAARTAHLLRALPGLVGAGERGLREWLIAQGRAG